MGTCNCVNPNQRGNIEIDQDKSKEIRTNKNYL